MLTQFFPPEMGAAQTRLASMAAELVRRGCSVEVVTAFPNHLTGKIFERYRHRFYGRETSGGMVIHRAWVYAAKSNRAPERILSYLSFCITSLVGLWSAKRPDYLFVESPPLFLAITAWLYSRLRGVPFIFNIADLWPDAVKKLGAMKNPLILTGAFKLEAWAYRSARYLTSVSEGMTRQLTTVKHIPPAKILYLPNGVDTELFQPRPPDESLLQLLQAGDRPIFLYAGTHGIAYDLARVLDVARTSPEFLFVFVGDGYAKASLQAKARSDNTMNAVFVDAQPLSEMPRFFSIACASLIPLVDNELFDAVRPAKIFPSLACGIPVVYGGRGEGAQIVRDAQAGLVVDPSSSQELNDAIVTLANDAALRERMGGNGRRYVLEHESWQSIVGRWQRELFSREQRR